LHKRGQDTPQVITRRLLSAGSEIAHAPEFEFVIINENFDVALTQLQAIVTAVRLRFASQAARQHELFAQLGIP
jgi:guanylate kinase